MIIIITLILNIVSILLAGVVGFMIAQIVKHRQIRKILNKMKEERAMMLDKEALSEASPEQLLQESRKTNELWGGVQVLEKLIKTF